jgi:hypothetical protein
MIRAAWSVVAAMLLVPASHAAAQARAAQPGRIEIAAGTLWIGASSFGSRDATETTGTNGRYRLFSTSTALRHAFGLESRVAVRITRSLRVEAGASYSRPRLVTRVSADVEDGASVEASDRVQQLTVDGGVTFELGRRPIGGRAVPFVMGSAGVLRQLHQEGLVGETGQVYQFGGGLRYVLGSRVRRARGIRVEARGVVRANGVTVDGGALLSPAFSALFFFGL